MQFLTDLTSNLLNLKRIKFFLCLLALLSLTSSQKTDITWTFISKVQITRPDKVSTDINSSLYMTDESGKTYKYDSLGNLLLIYSPQRNAAVSLIEASRGLNIFLFYREYQQYRLLNRFLTEVSVNSFDRNHAGFVRLSTLSADNNLWLIDDDKFALKKINLSLNRIEIENPLSLVLSPGEYDFSFMREYENKLYLADRNSGILVFDNLGNYLTTIQSKEIDYFNFVGRTLYYLSGDKLHLVDINKGTVKVKDLPAGVDVLKIILDKKKAYIFTPSSLEIFRHNLLL